MSYPWSPNPACEPGTWHNPLPFEHRPEEHVAAAMAGVWHCDHCLEPIGRKSAYGETWIIESGYLRAGSLYCGKCAMELFPKAMKHAGKGRIPLRRARTPAMWVYDLDLADQRRVDKGRKRQQWRRAQTEWHIEQGLIDGQSGQTKCEYNAGEL